jgi:hypothetical protein
MTEKEGILRMQPSGRWSVCRPGQTPVEITSGEVFRVEVDGELKPTRMEFRHNQKSSGVVELAGYYSTDNFPLRDGLRAAIGTEE